MKNLKKLTAGLVGLAALSPMAAFAGIIDAPTAPAGFSTDLTASIGTMIQGALGILGLVLVLLILLGGFRWMTAQGDESKVKEAKDIIIRAVVGLVIIALAYAIASYVTTQIIK